MIFYVKVIIPKLTYYFSDLCNFLSPEPCYSLREDTRYLPVSALPPLPRPGASCDLLTQPPHLSPEEDLPPPPPPHWHAGILHSPGQTVQEAPGAH